MKEFSCVIRLFIYTEKLFEILPLISSKLISIFKREMNEKNKIS